MTVPGAGWALRPAAPSDAAFLASLFASTRPELALLPDALAGPLIAQQQQWQELGYRRAFPHARHLIIESGGLAAGRLVLDQQPGQVRVVDIALAPPLRGHGLGTAVLRQVRDEAAAAGCDVVLSVAHDNLIARRLYAALGFKHEPGADVADEVRATLRWRRRDDPEGAL